jgi:hypothetical protein
MVSIVGQWSRKQGLSGLQADFPGFLTWQGSSFPRAGTYKPTNGTAASSPCPPGPSLL